MKTFNIGLSIIAIILLTLHISNYYFSFMSSKISYNFALGSLFCLFGILQKNINFKNKKMNKLKMEKTEKL